MRVHPFFKIEEGKVRVQADIRNARYMLPQSANYKNYVRTNAMLSDCRLNWMHSAIIGMPKDEKHEALLAIHLLSLLPQSNRSYHFFHSS